MSLDIDYLLLGWLLSGRCSSLGGVEGVLVTCKQIEKMHDIVPEMGMFNACYAKHTATKVCFPRNIEVLLLMQSSMLDALSMFDVLSQPVVKAHTLINFHDPRIPGVNDRVMYFNEIVSDLKDKPKVVVSYAEGSVDALRRRNIRIIDVDRFVDDEETERERAKAAFERFTQPWWSCAKDCELKTGKTVHTVLLSAMRVEPSLPNEMWEMILSFLRFPLCTPPTLPPVE